MAVDYSALADRLLKISARIAKQHRQRPPLDAFAMKACIDRLQSELSKVDALAASLRTAR